MILVVEDEPEFQEKIFSWIERVSRRLGNAFDISSGIHIALTEDDIMTWLKRCSTVDDPLLLIIDLEIDLEGIGPTSVFDVTQRLWRDNGAYLPKVPIIIYTGGSSMESQPLRNRGTVVHKNPPFGKTASQGMLDAVTEGLEAVLRTWGRIV